MRWSRFPFFPPFRCIMYFYNLCQCHPAELLYFKYALLSTRVSLSIFNFSECFVVLVHLHFCINFISSTSFSPMYFVLSCLCVLSSYLLLLAKHSKYHLFFFFNWLNAILFSLLRATGNQL